MWGNSNTNLNRPGSDDLSRVSYPQVPHGPPWGTWGWGLPGWGTWGFHPCHSLDRLRYCETLLVTYGLRFPGTLSTLPELALEDMYLHMISPTMFISFALPSLRKLVISQCSELPSVFQRLMAAKDEIQLQVLQLDFHDGFRSMHPVDLYNLFSFLQTFLSLEQFYLKVATSSWDEDYITISLQGQKSWRYVPSALVVIL